MHWIVGLKDGEFKFGKDTDDRLHAALKALSDANCKVHNVVIGNQKTWIVHHEQGLTVNCVPRALDLWDWLEKQDEEIDIEKVSISLYDQEWRKLPRK